MKQVTRRQLFSALGGALLAPYALAQQASKPGLVLAGAKEATTRLVLLGTGGGPSVRVEQAQSANVLFVNSTPYLIDCGYGTLRQLSKLGVGPQSIGHVFITHHHDDHNAELGTLLGMSWTLGRRQMVKVFGPTGMTKLVSGALEYFEPNSEIRTLDEGRKFAMKNLVEVKELAAPGLVFEDSNVRVTSARNTHFDEKISGLDKHLSLAFRFDTVDRRSIVFSGDTSYSTDLVALARGADVLVQEVIDVAGVNATVAKRWAKVMPPEEVKSVMRHIIEAHSTPEQVGRMASEAGVKCVVLNHITPGPVPEVGLTEQSYIDNVRKHFNGAVIYGHDMEEILIPGQP
ncbi:MBL fold metallo-hydrolase [Comamonas thiooxydans]|uniref:MBL fold metallo-hydrolase n=1 Tax=Comamonas thiooxydans TaxID=363952 RepID=UPI00050DF5D3|nr:MBL fold metallo-hydrolase [Comamonas thiooxydans]KGG87498.1 hypothetical protein P609_08065 [Comamonas thiooxydans]